MVHCWLHQTHHVASQAHTFSMHVPFCWWQTQSSLVPPGPLLFLFWRQLGAQLPFALQPLDCKDHQNLGQWPERSVLMLPQMLQLPHLAAHAVLQSSGTPLLMSPKTRNSVSPAQRPYPAGHSVKFPTKPEELHLPRKEATDPSIFAHYSTAYLGRAPEITARIPGTHRHQRMASQVLLHSPFLLRLSTTQQHNTPPVVDRPISHWLAPGFPDQICCYWTLLYQNSRFLFSINHNKKSHMWTLSFRHSLLASIKTCVQHRKREGSYDQSMRMMRTSMRIVVSQIAKPLRSQDKITKLAKLIKRRRK